MKDSPDWSFFTKRIYLHSSLEEAYAAWSVPEKIETWFLEKPFFIDQGKKIKASQQVAKGYHFRWKWHNWELEEAGKVLHANGKDEIIFTFGVGGEVAIKLVPHHTSIELILTQKNIPTDEESRMNIFVGCATGWTFWLTNLKAWLEYGITLHEKGLKQDQTDQLVNS
jgi:uncharacterized protein YndB with AHSA1/START domain